MRDIKFRAYDKLWEDNEYSGMRYDITDIEYINGKLSGVYLDGDYFELEEIEIMQYTGLKDKNGKEIYEGDIVHILGGIYEQGFYEWNEKITIKDLITDGHELRMIISQIGNESIEVIGNIYDNPELLEVKNNERSR